MVPAWIALCAWLIAWTALALLSLRLLKRVRPGERVPMRLRADGTPTWRVSPGVAAGLTPSLAVLVGVVTIVAAFGFTRGRAPGMNVALAAVFVFAHWTHITMAIRVLEKERG